MRIIYTTLMALEEIPQVYKTDAAGEPHTTPEQHIFILSSLPLVMDECEGIVKSITVFANTAIVMIITTGILICIWKRCGYSTLLIQSCFHYTTFQDGHV